MTFTFTDGQDPDFIALCSALDAHLNREAGGEANRAQYVPHNALDHIHDAVIAYDGDVAVGCGSFKRHGDGVAEVKRVFVREDHRGRGVARELMARLEQRAKEQGYTALILETGRHMADAVGLYHALGYRDIPNYGPYADMPGSVCMHKDLAR